MSRNSAGLTLAVGGALLALAAVFGAFTSPARADDAATTSMEMKITQAKTRADHEALAAQYEQEARDEHARAEEHEKMARAYARAGFGEKFNLQAHCKRIAERYEQAAQESQAMAKIHHALAEKAK